MRLLLIIFVLFSLSACTQQGQETSKSNIIGYVDLTMAGEETRFPVITIPKDGKSFANIYEAPDRVSISGITLAQNGGWQFPMISIVASIQDISVFKSIHIDYATETFRNDYAFTASSATETAKLTNLVMNENGLVEFEFSGQLVHQDRDPETGKTTPQEGKDSVEISGKVSVIIPAEFRQ